MANDCWAKLDKTTGSGNTTLNIYFDENDSGENRSVKIRVSSPDGEVVKEYTLVQSVAAPTIFYNERQAQTFRRQGCDEEDQRGEDVEYVVPAGRYSSVISVADANKKALEDIAQNGQKYANTNGDCITTLWYNNLQAKEFQKNDCDHDTEEGSTVTFIIQAGSVTSTISQADADAKALEMLNSGGQAYANAYGHCYKIKWYNERMSKVFRKNDCLATETGTEVEYIVLAGKYYSMVSQYDANQKALDDIDANGQAYANEHGSCETAIWYNDRQSKTFTRNNCEDGYIGTEYEYVVSAGKYSSTISKDDANQKALDDIEKNGQAAANLEGECVEDPNYFVGKASHVFTKEGCDEETQYGEEITVTEADVTGGPFVSHESQEDADALALAAVMEQGQAIANEKGQCLEKNLYTGEYSKEFTKNDCADNGVGSKVTVTQDDVTGGPFTSYESQQAANALAQEAVEAQGQEIANTKGNCTWTGTYSEQFTKNDCEEGYFGSTVTVTQNDVEGAPFTSNESQAAANSLAEAAVKEQGQAIANEAGECTEIIVYTGRYSQTFTRNDCADGGVGSEVIVTQDDVTGGPFTSEESQDAANQLARAAVIEQGQEIANSKGTCTWTGDYSESFTKNDCDEGETGSTVEVSADDCEGYPFTSNESLADANQKAKEAVEAQGQEIANKVGTCDAIPVYTGRYSKEFTRNDCAEGGVGSKVTVTQNDVTGGPFTSTESQEAANQLAEAAVEAQGQAIANSKGTCTWTGNYAQQFVKNDCEEGEQGSSMMINDEDCIGYPFTSTVSQEDANQKAQTAVEEQGQGIANAKGTCNDLTVYIGNYSQTFTPECEKCYEGVPMEVTSTMINGSAVTSTESQQAADDAAKALVEEQGQSYADKNGACNPMSTDPDWQNVDPENVECQEGKSMIQQRDANECSTTYNETRWVEGGDLTCSWNGKASQEFQKNDCEAGESAGSMVTVTEADMEGVEESGYPFTSFESQEAANALAEAAVALYGQQVANEKGTCNECGYYEQMFYRNDCGTCMEDLVGIMVTSDMVGGPFCDPDPEVANQKAKQAVEENGQAYVNKNGAECTPKSTDPVWVDSEPLETECRDGKSYKKQVNTNECYSGEQEQWVEGGGLTCLYTAPDSSQEFTRTCDNNGVGGTVTVQSSQLPGYPFTSTVSQEDAERIRDAAFTQHGETVAAEDPGWTCLWTATYSAQFTRNDCADNCDKGTSINVSSDYCGGPFTSNVSYADALSKAQAAVNEQGQDYANKNGDCINDPAKDSPSWTDTGTTSCSGCTSMKQQRDTNTCSPTYNSTQNVAGGGKDCTSNGSWGSWSSYSCSGCTRSRTRTNTCGAVETDSTSNASECGSSVQQSGYSCNGTYSVYTYRNSCSGSTSTSQRQVSCQCGYGGGDYDTAVGSATCRSGVSQRQYRDSCGNTTWKNEGTACTASYNCSNLGSDSGSEGDCSYTCTYSGTQSASGSTTSAAESAAKAKCTCSKTYSYKRICPIGGISNEDGCQVVTNITGGGTGTGSSCSSAQSNAPSCTYKKVYTFTYNNPISNSDCNNLCPNRGTSNGVSAVVTGSQADTCSAAKSSATSAYNSHLSSNYTKYCNCTQAKTWNAYLSGMSCDCGLYGCQAVDYIMTYTNDCGTTKTLTASWSGTPSSTGYPSSGTFSVTVPTGSGSISGSYFTGRNFQCGTMRASGSGSGNC